MNKVKIFSRTRSYISNQFLQVDYTLQHKKAYLRVEKELLGKNTISGYLHDTNKVVMYALLVPIKLAHRIHRKLSAHHVKNGRVKNPIAAVIDWECARETKPIKEYQARDVYEQFYPNVAEVQTALKKLGLWDSPNKIQ